MFNSLAQAQQIRPANDGTGTTISTVGNRYNIGGGTLSRDGSNLFHSFQEFGLSDSQIANFLTNPGIRNILGRVVGGDASIINGLITVTGGNSNLFLVNPAGIIFGQNASLNVPGSFTATTATAIGFDDRWFQSLGVNNYRDLIGVPSAFDFGNLTPGSIINLGNLTVASGQDLTLLGGVVVNNGTLAAPGGKITVAAISNDVVRISQFGHLLSLDVGVNARKESIITPLSLPQLLTGVGGNHATGMTVNSAGEVILTASGLKVENGDVVVATSGFGDAIAGNSVILSAANNLTLAASRLYTTGNLTLQGGNSVIVRDSVAHPFVARVGGNLDIQGDRHIDILALNPIPGMESKPQFQSGGNLTLVSNGNISSDSHFVAGGTFSLRNLSGQPANFVSKYDPIFSAEGDVIFGDYTGVSLKVETKGSIIGGNIEITGPDLTLTPGVDPDIAILRSGPALILRSGVLSLANSPNLTGDITTLGDTNFTSIPISSSSITVGTISAGGQVILSAVGDIVTSDISGGEVAIASGRSITTGGLLQSNNTIDLQAAGNILTNDISIIDNDSANINLTSNNGSIETGAIAIGENGAIDLKASGKLTVESLQGGAVSVQSDSTVNVTKIDAKGNVSITAGEAITLGSLNATGGSNNVSLNAENDINIEFINAPDSNVDIRTPQFVRATGTFTDQNGVEASISTAGDNGGGNIAIRHGGGDTNPVTPFVVGDAAVNGTAGAIASNSNNIIRPRQSFNNSFTQNNIEIITTNQITPIPTPTPTIIPTPTPTIIPTPIPTVIPTPIPTIIPTPIPTVIPTPIPTIIPTPIPTVIPTPIPIIPTPTPTIIPTPTPTIIPTPTPTIIPTPIPIIPTPIPTIIPTPTIPMPISPIPPSSNPLTDILQPNQNPLNLPINLQRPSNPLQSNLLNFQPKNIYNLNSENAKEAVFNSTFRDNITKNFNAGDIAQALVQIEKSFSQEYGDYFGRNFSQQLPSINEIQTNLQTIQEQTGTKPSLIYVFSREEQLDLILVTPSGSIIHKSVPEAKRKDLIEVLIQFKTDITNPRLRNTTIYLSPARLLYKWIVEPLEPTLQERGIDTIAFIMDKGLRGMPISALYDGQKFLMEKYNLSLMPSINLTDTRYVSVKTSPVLAMGASEFVDLSPLPAVPIELSTIISEWPGVSFLNQTFTLENLKRQRRSQPFGIIHLATHGEFQAGEPSNSFIQLWDTKLQLDQLRQLRLNDPPVELLVLSACKTAVGDGEAELGFGGLAVQAGVKTALASLWYVSDEGTLGLMTEFYNQLKKAPIKSAALRQTQIAMLRGQVRLEGGKLLSSVEDSTIQLPESLQKIGNRKLSHPFYWSAFVMIGSPW